MCWRKGVSYPINNFLKQDTTLFMERLITKRFSVSKTPLRRGDLYISTTGKTSKVEEVSSNVL